MDTHSSVNNPNIGLILLESGKINPQDADRIIKAQQEYNLRFGDAAVKLGLVSQDDILHAVSQQFSYSSLSSENSSVEREVYAAFTNNANELEQLRTLRSQLSLRWFSNHTSLVITSARSDTGVSNVVANLAVMFSRLGQKTLIIDADLRGPRQHSLFKIPNKTGLTDILAERSDFSAINTVEELSNLSVLTSGTDAPNPLELLSKTEFWGDIEKDFDVILIDSPPAMECADAQTISSKVKGCLVVTKTNYTRLSDVKDVQEQMEIAGADIVGAVINNF
jgi:chain length determinant protein tyrosine kinase EpsG